MIVRPPFAPGLQACRHDGTVHPHQPAPFGTPPWDRAPGECPQIYWPTADPLWSNGVGACGGSGYARSPRPWLMQPVT